LGNRGASGIDGFVSTALGVAAAEPGSPTYALAGDLSFLHDLGALAWSGRRTELDLVLIVVNNDGGVIFSFLDQTVLPEHERLFTTPHGLDLRTICAAFGVGYERAERAADVMPAVRRAAEAGGVRIVEIPVDREENVRRHREVQEAARRALHAEGSL
jgi:2-succinyl-5-enolpyruvyl-6-hydroxy-3-cyclohexene-1-carboxylate synthase